jgi:lysophospholipase L1-like esterase
MIALLGDSLSVGSFPSLQKRIPDAQLFAKVGDPISKMLARVEDIVGSGANTVLVMGGTNDLADKNASVDTIFGRLSKLVDTLDSRGLRVIVSSIPPQRSANNERVKDYNQRILFGALGENVKVADVGGVVSVDDLSADGLHPNLSTYRRMGEAWAKAYEDIDKAPLYLIDKSEEQTSSSSGSLLLALAGSAVVLTLALKK